MKISLVFVIKIIYIFQSTWRLWGEEKVEGAVFSVYLKKVN